MDRGNSMTAQTLPIGETYEKAKEIVEILKLWEITKSDALSIARQMVASIEKETEESWAKSNPLIGTGLKYAP